MKKLTVLLLLLASTAYGDIYTWKDSHGVTHYVSSQYDIPARYLSRAKMYDPATGKTKPLSAATTAAPAQRASGTSPAAPAITPAAPTAVPMAPPVAPSAQPAVPPTVPGVTAPTMQPSPGAPPIRSRRQSRQPSHQEE